MEMTVTINAARSSLGLGRTKLYELINEGAVDTIRVGRRRLVTVESLQAFVQAKLNVHRVSIHR